MTPHHLTKTRKNHSIFKIENITHQVYLCLIIQKDYVELLFLFIRSSAFHLNLRHLNFDNTNNNSTQLSFD